MKKIFFLLLCFTFSVIPMNDDVINFDEEDIDNTHTNILNIIQTPRAPQELSTRSCLFICGMVSLGAALVFTKYSMIFYNAYTKTSE